MYPRRFFPIWAAVGLLATSIITFADARASTPKEGNSAMDPHQLFKQAKAAYAKVTDYTATFHKRERVGRRLLPKETMFMKFREPFSVYMKWVENPHKGRQILYVQGQNSNQIKAKEGGFLGVMTVNLNPTSRMAMRGQRGPITRAGIGNLLELLSSNFEKATAMGGLELKIHPNERVHGRETLKFEGILPKGKGLYCERAIVFIDKELMLPIKVIIYDEGNQLVEEYSYENLKLNVGLTDFDFDPNNKEYGF